MKIESYKFLLNFNIFRKNYISINHNCHILPPTKFVRKFCRSWLEVLTQPMLKLHYNIVFGQLFHYKRSDCFWIPFNINRYWRILNICLAENYKKIVLSSSEGNITYPTQKEVVIILLPFRHLYISGEITLTTVGTSDKSQWNLYRSYRFICKTLFVNHIHIC